MWCLEVIGSKGGDGMKKFSETKYQKLMDNIKQAGIKYNAAKSKLAHYLSDFSENGEIFIDELSGDGLIARKEFDDLTFSNMFLSWVIESIQKQGSFCIEKSDYEKDGMI